ncbi:hypothetical protein ACPPVT_07515 [Angustibacter sp. McL0619]|uniref:hypothetical protein n=1 Tax=Angustibacter sp. McL0619 TaxID=3415676 RepID=UPI003CEAB07B
MDYTTPDGQVRLLIADVAEDPDEQVLDDDQVAGFLALEAGVVKLAAAAALEAIAVSEVLVSKVIRTQDLATDGTKVSAELRARATALRAQAAELGELDDDAFTVVDFRPRCGPEHVSWC